MARHIDFWGLNKQALVDLRSFSLAVPDDRLYRIIQEPLLLLRYLVQKDLPFTDLFTLPWSIVQKGT